MQFRKKLATVVYLLQTHNFNIRSFWLKISSFQHDELSEGYGLGKCQHRNRKIAGRLLSSLFTRAMPIITASSPPISLGYGETATIDELAGSDLSDQVSVAFVVPSDAGSNALYVAMHVVGTLYKIRILALYFCFGLLERRDTVPPGFNLMQPAHRLRRLTVTSGSVGAMVALINHAPALEYLSISFYSMTCGAETDTRVGDGALSCLRRLLVRHIDTPFKRKYVTQILESNGGIRWMRT